MATEPSAFGTRPERSLTLYRLIGFGDAYFRGERLGLTAMDALGKV
jgi:hypothetical protein